MTTPPQSDASLVRAHRGGDPQATAMLVEHHLGLVHTIAFARLGNHEAAEDLAQEVVIHALLHLEKLRQPDRFAPWLAQITRNLAADWQRKHRRRSALVPLVPLEHAEEIADTDTTGARDMMEERDRQRLVHEALRELPEEQREVVSLHFIEGMPQTEIASSLGMTPSRVNRQIKRALKKIQGTLAEAMRGAMADLRMPTDTRAKTTALALALVALPEAARAEMVAQTVATAIPVGAVGVTSGVVFKLKVSLMGLGGAGVIGLGVMSALPDEKQAPDQATLAKEDLSENPLGMALEAYHDLYGRYPRWVPGSDPSSVATDDPLMQEHPTFTTEDFQEITRIHGGYIFDAHNPRGTPNSYMVDGDQWILTCPGHDDDFDFNARGVFVAGMTTASPEIIDVVFDATNGANSNGDIIMIGP